MRQIKGMLAEGILRPIEQKRVDIQNARIDACVMIIDYLHDDVPHKDQQPLLDLLRTLRSNLIDELFDATTP